MKVNKKLNIYKKLEKNLIDLSSFALAFSGGADSSLLLSVAKTIDPKQFVAITAVSQFVSKKEIDFAKKIAASFNVNHICLDVDILENKDVTPNTLERCYFCKKQMFTMIRDCASQHGIKTLIHGVNLDDLKDFRPGLKAASELGFISPLADAGFFKKDIRILSKNIGLQTWNKPSQSCLATRIVHNEKITFEKLDRIQKAEDFLSDFEFTQIRVRCQDETARIEVDSKQIVRLLDSDIRQKISRQFLKLGFKKISIDIDGYQNNL